jgi:hypothetical protein
VLRPIARLALVIAMLAAGHAATSAAHPPAKVRTCGSFRDPDGDPVGVVVQRGKPTCATGKRSYAPTCARTPRATARRACISTSAGRARARRHRTGRGWPPARRARARSRPTRPPTDRITWAPAWPAPSGDSTVRHSQMRTRAGTQGRWWAATRPRRWPSGPAELDPALGSDRVARRLGLSPAACRSHLYPAFLCNGRGRPSRSAPLNP